ncbi:MAG TPA: Rrf2 family transcriptional regulator [Opitutus sp.]|nr:Rrf2 family transcriptional regulator [Opitutus sp.]
MTRNSRFAVSVHILAYLAYRAGSAVSSSEIAGSVDTNPVVIRRLLSALVKARLVTAQKGATGGFSLACAPEEISLLDIYRAVHAQPSPALRHFAPNQLCPVGARIETIIGDLFAKAQASMEAELARATLSGINHQVQHACAAK